MGHMISYGASLASRILERRQELSLNQGALAAACGVSRAAVSQWEKGATVPTGPHLVPLARVLQTTEQWLVAGAAPKQRRDIVIGIEPAEINQNPDLVAPEAIFDQSFADRGLLPVFAAAEAGKGSILIDRTEPVERIRMPGPLVGVRGAFGMYVVGTSMEPAYRQGEMLLIHPHRPYLAGDDVLVILDDDNGSQEALVKQFVSGDQRRVRLRQHNPRKEIEIAKSEISGLYLVVGKFGVRV